MNLDIGPHSFRKLPKHQEKYWIFMPSSIAKGYVLDRDDLEWEASKSFPMAFTKADKIRAEESALLGNITVVRSKQEGNPNLVFLWYKKSLLGPPAMRHCVSSIKTALCVLIHDTNMPKNCYFALPHNENDAAMLMDAFDIATHQIDLSECKTYFEAFSAPTEKEICTLLREMKQARALGPDGETIESSLRSQAISRLLPIRREAC